MYLNKKNTNVFLFQIVIPKSVTNETGLRYLNRILINFISYQ